MTPEQIRAARELLKWSRERLMLETGIAVRTLWLTETGQRQPRVSTLVAIQTALEADGVEFTNGDQPGVRLRWEAER